MYKKPIIAITAVLCILALVSGCDFLLNTGEQGAVITINNEAYSSAVVFAGTWSTSSDSREVSFTSSGVLPESTSDAEELPAGTYNFWMEMDDVLYYFVEDGPAAALITIKDGNRYALTLNRNIAGEVTWFLENLDDPTDTAGSVPDTGTTTPPSVPGGYVPADNATEISNLTTLDWDTSPESGVTYDVYLDTVDASTLLVSGLTQSTHDLQLEVSTQYFWKIVAVNADGNTEGLVSTFTTSSTDYTAFSVSLSTIEPSATNAMSIEITADFGANIDLLQAADITIGGGATVSNISGFLDSRTFDLLMPTSDATITISIAADTLTSTSGLTSLASNQLQFDYYHHPFTEVRDIVFQADSNAAWAIDNPGAKLLRYDVTAGAVLNSWLLEDAFPASIARVGNQLYIGYENSKNISRFTIDQTIPANSSLDTQWVFAVNGGETLSATRKILADELNSQLLIIFQDTSHFSSTGSLTALALADGSETIAASAIDGHTGAYANGKLIVSYTETSPYDGTLYTVGASSISLVAYEWNLGSNLKMLSMNSDGTRILAPGGGGNALGTGPAYRVSDIKDDAAGGLIQQGYWDLGIYGGQAIFSPDDTLVYLTNGSPSDETLGVYNAVYPNYTLVRTLEFPNSGDYARIAVSSDGNKVLGFSYDTYYDELFRFYLFTDVK